MSKNPKNELEHWIFVDSWEGFLPWKQERHFTVEITSDVSNSGWGGILSFPGGSKETRDYWCPEDFECPGGIAVKEAKALFRTLSTFSEDVLSGKVDAFVDNKTLLDFWNNEGGRNIPLANEIKDLFFLTLQLNILLNVYYVWSDLNDAGSPSRFSSDIDCSLSDLTWALVEASFGRHSVDLMAIPSNVKRSRDVEKLKFFSPHPCKESSGANVFAQNLSMDENYYVFPPFVLIGSLIRFLKRSPVRVTLIAPDISPRKY